MKKSLLLWVLAFPSFLSLSQERHGLNRESLASLRKMHSAVTGAVTSGKSLDAQISGDIHLFTSLAAGSSEKLTYRDALKIIEKEIAEAVPSVKVVIDCSPDRCAVRYRPLVADVGWRDAGNTKVSLNLDPKTYVFGYQCGEVQLSQVVDCTTDQNLTFACSKK